MLITETKCPICGSDNIEIKKDIKSIRVPLAEPVQQNFVYCHCKDCLADVLIESESKKEMAKKSFDSGKASMPLLIDKVKKSGIPDTRLERALRLAPHTVSRWKQGKQVSAAVMALTRYLAIMPELVEIAEKGFDEKFARKKIISKTFEKIKEYDDSFQAYYCENEFGYHFKCSALKNHILQEEDDYSNFEKYELAEAI
ncbi:hypothetical protein [uncultured Fibrobacter sp.]|uniref:hypothetical protein n=1 Tax=uncultured Fibrobacter sp. TaxID=261512 RepID=UPI0025FBBB76|nr:hypothetical protein [uncultured Fibrobacter sp.]